MIKKLSKLFPLLIAVMIAVGATSCSKDDDNTFFSGPYNTFGIVRLKSDVSILLEYYNSNNANPTQMYINTANYTSSLDDILPGSRVMVTYNITNRQPSGNSNSTSIQLLDIYNVKTLLPVSTNTEDCTVGNICIPVNSLPFVAGGYINIVSSFADRDKTSFVVDADNSTLNTRDIVLYLRCTEGSYKEADGEVCPLSIDVSSYMADPNTRTVTLKLLDTSNLTKTYTFNKN